MAFVMDTRDLDGVPLATEGGVFGTSGRYLFIILENCGRNGDDWYSPRVDLLMRDSKRLVKEKTTGESTETKGAR